MGFLRRLFGGAMVRPAAWFDCPPNPYRGDLYIARWEVHYAAYARLVPDGDQRDVLVELVREPGNVHDRNAVALWCEGLQVGYIPRQWAGAWAPFVDDKNRRGLRVRAQAMLRTEYERRRMVDTGAWLYLPQDPGDYARWEKERPQREAAEEAERRAKADRKAARAAETQARREVRELEHRREQEAKRMERGQSRSAAEQLEADRRARRLCVDCGAPIEPTGARGRPTIRCAVHAAEARARR